MKPKVIRQLKSKVTYLEMKNAPPSLDLQTPIDGIEITRVDCELPHCFG